MLTLKVINKSFLKNESKHLKELKKLFVFLAQMQEWSSLKGIINLILIDDEEMQTLNHQYRKINKTTDVLSFPYFQTAEIFLNNNQKEVIGEILISRNKAILDAQDLQISFQAELNKLLVHGVLHILGYDHVEDNDFLVMQKKENKVLKSYQKEKKAE